MSKRGDAGTTRVCVKNLPKHVDDRRLREHFQRKGVVTDVKVLRTPDGRSRQLGFVGFRTAEDAREAVRYFDNTFLDTSKISVEAARPVPLAAEGDGGDPSERPWSKYSAGSSAHARRNPTAAAENPSVADPRGASGVQRKDPRSLLEKEMEGLKGDAKFDEFMQLAGRKGKAWMAGTPATEAPAAKVVTETVQSLRYGSRGEAVQRTRIQFADSSDEDGSDSEEYQDIPNSVKKDKAEESNEEEVAEEEEKEQQEDEAEGGEERIREERETAEKRKKKEDEEEVDIGRLFVRNLGYDVTEEELLEHFSKVGPVAEVHVPIDVHTRKSKGLAFVRFVAAEHAAKAMRKLDATSFMGRLMHILPARVNAAGAAATAIAAADGAGGSSYKSVKERQRAESAGSAHNWNPLIMRTDAVVDAIAHFNGLLRADVLDPEASNLATRVAIAETRILEETRRYFRDHGINFDAGADLGPKQPRSGVAMLVKNIPFGTTESQLRTMFGRHGALVRVLLPPTRAIAMVEFEQPTEARAAFRALAYSRLGDMPIYLEWTPQAIIGAVPAGRKVPAAAAASATDEGFVIDRRGGAQAAVERVLDSEADAASSASRTLFVKNLNFTTTDAGLRALFERCGTVQSATVARKRDTSQRGAAATQSLGYGFVEFKQADEALAAIKQLQGTELDEHALVLAFARAAGRNADPAEERRAEKRKRDASLGVQSAKPTAKLMVRNVAFEATKAELRELFGTFGELKNVRLPKKMDGSHRGFAFVEFVSPEVAREAFRALQHTHLYGRHLVVEFSTEDSLGAPSK